MQCDHCWMKFPSCRDKLCAAVVLEILKCQADNIGGDSRVDFLPGPTDHYTVGC